MLSSASGMIREVTRSNLRMHSHPSGICDFAGDSRSGGGQRRCQECLSAGTLPALKVPIARTDGALSWFQPVAVHCDTHTASRLTPFGPGIFENAIETFCFGLTFHRL